MDTRSKGKNKKNTSIKLLSIMTLVTFSFFLPACSSKNNFLDHLNKNFHNILDRGQDLFSNRPQNRESFLAIIKLKKAPLLTSSKKEKGITVYDASLNKEIEEEQNSFKKELENLSSDIKIIYSYKYVLNGVAIVCPLKYLDTLKGLAQIAYLENEAPFGRPEILKTLGSDGVGGEANSIAEFNSVKFIGADRAREKNLLGQGIRVGVIDTGIDYTHAMFKGAGTEEAYKNIDPSKPSSAFPNEKVVGGIDLVGTAFDAGSPLFEKRIPIPDGNPLDEQEHGTHIAGSVAGYGDNINTHDGVAPEAKLYAIKVFGADGSTGDAAVIAALEYAINPKGDGILNDQLDVVNLSLGSPFGSPHVLYSEAIRNTVLGGTVVVASAGNSGANNYIVGSPSTTDEALSVAASIDNAPQNWKFSAVKFTLPGGSDKLVEAYVAAIGKPLKEIESVEGKLVFVGLADTDLSGELAESLKGNIAFIDRGKVNFSEKIRRAQAAGAIGVVVANNQAGSPMIMGGEGKYEIPAIMITLELGNLIKDEMKKGDVRINFKTPETIDKPELIDTITSFSSKGPRSIDSSLKPEISAPGYNVISAEKGKGKGGVAFSGTSMSSPLMSGVMALLKQAHPELSPLELKSLAMGSSKLISNEKKELYPVTQQGAGRVEIGEALKAVLVSDKSSFSLGEQNIQKVKILQDKVELKNISNKDVFIKVNFRARSQLIAMSPSTSGFSLGSLQSYNLSLAFRLDGQTMKTFTEELDGWIELEVAGAEGPIYTHRIPVLALIKKTSVILADDLRVLSTNENDGPGSMTTLKIKNEGTQVGEILAFNTLGFNPRKSDANNDRFLNRECNIQAAGYRIIQKKLEDGKKASFLQIAIKLYEPMTTWESCSLSVLIDSNEDGLAEQELAALQIKTVAGFDGLPIPGTVMSLLLDAGKARQIRKDFEKASAAGSDPKKDFTAIEDYVPATLGISESLSYNNSTVLVVESDVTLLARRPTGELAVKIAALYERSNAVEPDNYLENDAKSWRKISIDEKTQAFYGMPEQYLIQPGYSGLFSLNKGYGKESLLLFYPRNNTVFSDLLTDNQSQELKPVFGM